MDKDVLHIRPQNSVGFNLPFSSEKKVNILTFLCQASTDWDKRKNPQKQELKAITLDKTMYLMSHYFISKY